MKLDGISALVTGGVSGLGAATAQALAERGVRVIAVDLPSAVEQAKAPVAGISYVGADVTDVEAVQAAVAEAAGDAAAPLRLAINCAGIAPSARLVGRKGAHDPELFAKTININVIGTFNVMNAAANAMAATEAVDEHGQRGVVVNTASVAAFEGQVGQVAYAASKGAVHAMTISAARDLASKGIRVNTIAPGIVDTPMLANQITPEFREQLEALVQFPARLAKPSEFAQLVIAIADNDYLNGETIRLDGALRMPPR